MIRLLQQLNTRKERALPQSLTRDTRTPATNPAGNFHNALGCADATAYLRKTRLQDSSGTTQVALPTLLAPLGSTWHGTEAS